MFDWKKPTVEMLGRWQPWHDGHIELFKRALQKTGQVCIMYRDVGGSDAGIDGQADNPFQFEEVNTAEEAGITFEVKPNLPKLKGRLNDIINSDGDPKPSEINGALNFLSKLEVNEEISLNNINF